MLKNASPLQLTYYASLFIGVLQLLFLLTIQYFGWLEIGNVSLSLITLFCFIISFVTIFLTIRFYLYRKIQLIYRNLHSVELTSKKEVSKMRKEGLEKVEKDVTDWVVSRQKEIETLKSLEEYRKSFMGDISHELKTPIFSIQGYVHTLLEGGLYDESINIKYLRRAANNIDRLHTIVEDLESISNLETGKLRLKHQSFDIKKLTLEVFDDLEMSSQKKGIQLEIKKDAVLNINVHADREKIRQVLTNLVINSIKYGKEAGTTRVGFYDLDELVLIEVTDNGIGIEGQHLKHLFDRFYRVDKSRSRLQGGSGLGLSIVKHILEAHQQTIRVKSIPQKGSSFSFNLFKA